MTRHKTAHDKWLLREQRLRIRREIKQEVEDRIREEKEWHERFIKSKPRIVYDTNHTATTTSETYQLVSSDVMLVEYRCVNNISITIAKQNPNSTIEI